MAEEEDELGIARAALEENGRIGPVQSALLHLAQADSGTELAGLTGQKLDLLRRGDSDGGQ